MRYTANTTGRRPDRRIAFQRKMEKVAEWSNKPMSNRAQVIASTIAGTVMFAVLFTVYMIA